MCNMYVSLGHTRGTKCDYWKFQAHNFENTPEDVDNFECSEDVGMFNEIQEAANLGQLYSSDVYSLPRLLT